MRKHNLVPNKGLSLSQAQSISNLCNQRTVEINKKFDSVNNYGKSIELNGKQRILANSKPLPENTIELLGEKAKLHACQAFLMENIKTKDLLLKEAKTAVADISGIEVPEKPKLSSPVDGSLAEVDEAWGWNQLPIGEINEYLEAEAYAAHVGQFIHKGSILDELRRTLPNIPAIEWITVKDGEKTPVDINIHHNADELMELHEELAGLHRKFEQRVNYFKAKVKNLVTAENARIAEHNNEIANEVAKQNALLQAKYDKEFAAYQDEVRKIRTDFEKQRQKRIAEIASMRIGVDARFQEVVDMFLKQLDKE
ncbi:MAG: hypothetical protein ACOC22_01120 [bacterium]